MRWVHILVLVEIVVEIVERLLTLVSVKVDGVGRCVSGLKCAGNQWHELAKYADTAMPESRLRKPCSKSPRVCDWVVRFHHI